MDSEEELKLKRRKNNPAANLLSSVILIKTGIWHVLLTSDSTLFTIRRLYKSCLDRLNKQLVVIQIPHHGSGHSHFDDFWLSILNRKEASAFVSVGGQMYGIPNKEVIEFFDKNYKEIHSTNFVGGFKEYFKNKKHKVRRTVNQDVSNHFYTYDSQFLKYKTSPVDCDKDFGCGEKKIKIEENGFFSIKTNSSYR
jgi:beta-lactamase superfamily II metal-dependent hydrolase